MLRYTHIAFLVIILQVIKLSLYFYSTCLWLGLSEIPISWKTLLSLHKLQWLPEHQSCLNVYTHTLRLTTSAHSFLTTHGTSIRLRATSIKFSLTPKSWKKFLIYRKYTVSFWNYIVLYFAFRQRCGILAVSWSEVKEIGPYVNVYIYCGVFQYVTAFWLQCGRNGVCSH